MQVTRRYWALLVLLLFLSGCQIQKTAPEIAGPSTPGLERDSVLEAQRIAFSPELEETWEWIVLDAKEEQILYAIQEKRINQEQMYSYRLTREIGIYDADRSQVTAQWQPETPGWYQAGAITGAGSACCAGAVDYTHVYPSEYVLVCLDQKQTELQTLHGTLQQLEALTDGTVVFSFVADTGRFGVGSVAAGQVQEILSRQTQGQTEPLAGELSVSGTEFSYVYAEDGRCTLIRADRSVELQRWSLEPEKEKLDCCCLTPNGLLACLSLEEDTDAFRRELTFFPLQGDKTVLRRSGADGALYRIRFGETWGLAVNSSFHLQVLQADASAVACTAARLPEVLEAQDGTAVHLNAADGASFYLFYPRSQELYRVSFPEAA